MRVQLRSRSLSSAAVATFALFLSVTPPRLWSQPSTWQMEAVDCLPDMIGMTDRSLRVDAAGYPCVAYGGDHLYFQWSDDEGWHKEIVDQEPQVGSFASLALLESGAPHIVYADEPQGLLKHAYRSSSGWAIETIDNGAVVTTSIASLGDTIYVCYILEPGDLTYARCDGSSWVIETVTTGIGPLTFGRYLSMAVDPEGTPHVGFNCDQTVKYAWRDGAGWNTTVVDNMSWANMGLSLALDDGGHPCMCYWQYYHLTYKYAHLEGAVWEIETIFQTMRDAEHSSLAVNSQGVPCVALTDGIFDCVLYAERQGVGVWDLQVIQSGTFCRDISMAFDAEDRPCVSFCGAIEGALKIATKHAGGTWWDLEVLDRTGDIGGLNSMALDAQGFPHISYVATQQHTVKHIRWDGMSWTAEVVDSLSNPWGRTSLAVDSSGRPSIAYMSLNPDILLYATWDGAWITEVVDAVGSTGWCPSLALDALDCPHVSYFADNSTLRYASRSGGTWEFATVDGGVADEPSLAIDSQGHTHIAYFSNAADGLKYAYYNGSAWEFSFLDADQYGRYCSLALDGESVPSVAYEHDSTHSLRFARCGGDTWITEVVPGTGLCSGHVSLALSPGGEPHIVFYSDGLLLKHAYLDGTTWVVESLGCTAAPDDYVTASIDGAGNVHVSYRDDATSDLFYAYRPSGGFPLAGRILGGSIQLTWVPVHGAAAYWVYGSPDAPFFLPGGPPGYAGRIDVLPPDVTSWASDAGLGSPVEDWTYLIMAVDEADGSLLCSSRVGERDYEAHIP